MVSLIAKGVENVLDKSSFLSASNYPVLVGGDTDGASVNVSEQNGMKAGLKGSSLGFSGPGAFHTSRLLKDQRSFRNAS